MGGGNKGKSGKNRKSIYEEDVQGFALDLSLRGLETIKVVELALLPLVTTLDLSNNKIIIIPEEFGTLTHLVRLDLSYNLIQSLPESIGSLTSLRHLDLFSNKLKRLPWSFGHLDELVWLDIGNNPIDATFIPPELASSQVATSRSADKASKDAAKKIVAHMKEKLQNREKKLEKEQKKAERLAELEREREGALRLDEQKRKREEKERRKKEAEAKRAALIEAVKQEEESKGLNGGDEDEPESDGIPTWLVGISFVIGFIAIVLGILYYLMPEDFPRLLMDWLAMLAGGASWWD